MNNPNPMSSMPPPHQPNQDGQYLLILQSRHRFLHITQHHDTTQTRNELCRVSRCSHLSCDAHPPSPSYKERSRWTVAVTTWHPGHLLASEQDEEQSSSCHHLCCLGHLPHIWVRTFFSLVVVTSQVVCSYHSPSQPNYHDGLWWLFGLSVQSWLFTEWGKLWTQDGIIGTIKNEHCMLYYNYLWLI